MDLIRRRAGRSRSEMSYRVSNNTGSVCKSGCLNRVIDHNVTLVKGIRQMDQLACDEKAGVGNDLSAADTTLYMSG